MHDWGTYAHNATALFVIANPIGVTPLFISLTNRQTEEQRRHTARLTATTVVIVSAAMFLGEAILHLFGIRMASFRAAGGILILLMAIAMLQARPSPTHHTVEESKEAAIRDEVAVVPLGIPLVAGPGAISTVIIYADQAVTWFDMAVLFLTILGVAGSLWIALRLSDESGCPDLLSMRSIPAAGRWNWSSGLGPTASGLRTRNNRSQISKSLFFRVVRNAQSSEVYPFHMAHSRLATVARFGYNLHRSVRRPQADTGLLQFVPGVACRHPIPPYHLFSSQGWPPIESKTGPILLNVGVDRSKGVTSPCPFVIQDELENHGATLWVPWALRHGPVGSFINLQVSPVRSETDPFAVPLVN